mmetsp:Transcript_7522/g.23551  ORF Transcript_7522/g.23551 Transcript_7522/m.23551 type:complete len:218 (-) Transcript_7522:83-736(-)
MTPTASLFTTIPMTTTANLQRLSQTRFLVQQIHRPVRKLQFSLQLAAILIGLVEYLLLMLTFPAAADGGTNISRRHRFHVNFYGRHRRRSRCARFLVPSRLISSSSSSASPLPHKQQQSIILFLILILIKTAHLPGYRAHDLGPSARSFPHANFRLSNRSRDDHHVVPFLFIKTLTQFTFVISQRNLHRSRFVILSPVRAEVLANAVASELEFRRGE